MEISQATMLYVAKLIVICDSQCVYALSSIVPSPIVQVNFASRATATYAGNSVTLNCTIMLTEGITDSGFTVNSTWTKNGVMFPGVSGRITVNDTTRVSGTTFFNKLVFSSLSTRDNGTYTCVVTLSSSYEFVADAMVLDSTSLAVEGMAIKLKFIGLAVQDYRYRCQVDLDLPADNISTRTDIYPITVTGKIHCSQHVRSDSD